MPFEAIVTDIAMFGGADAEHFDSTLPVTAKGTACAGVIPAHAATEMIAITLKRMISASPRRTTYAPGVSVSTI